MSTFTHRLTPLELAEESRILQPPRGPLETVTAESPALSVMTDLSMVRLITIGADVAVDTALAVMIHAKVRLLLVIDGDGAITGLVSALDLMGEKPLRVASEERTRRDEVTVAQVMTRVADIKPLDWHNVEHATVRAIVRHLLDCHTQHALVVSLNEENGSYIARGIFSLTQIGRQLGETIDLGEARAENFAELERLIS